MYLTQTVVLVVLQSSQLTQVTVAYLFIGRHQSSVIIEGKYINGCELPLIVHTVGAKSSTRQGRSKKQDAGTETSASVKSKATAAKKDKKSKKEEEEEEEEEVWTIGGKSVDELTVAEIKAQLDEVRKD